MRHPLVTLRARVFGSRSCLFAALLDRKTCLFTRSKRAATNPVAVLRRTDRETCEAPVVARITLPKPTFAPALRGSLEAAADFRVADLGDDEVDVEPAEGAGATRAFLQAHRLCDAGTAITPAVWAPLAQHPAYEGNPERRQRLLEQAAQLARIDTAPAMLQAISAAVAGFRNDELPGWLEQQLDRLFQLFPNGSLWLVSVQPVLLTRLTLLGGTFALEVTPDFPLDPNNVHGFDALDENSLTRGVAFGKALEPALLAFSPGAVGYAFDRQPHALVLLFGFDGELREAPPRSLSSLYEPTVFEDFGDVPWKDPDFRENLDPSDIESLLQWWVSRLNVFYSHAADPTRFVDDDGKHDPAAQRAWFLTFERMLADATLILAAPQLAALARMAAAFDFLDKAEALLGYGRDGSGSGFKRLLRRSEMTRRLEQAWQVSLPVRLRPRFQRHVEALFASIHTEVHDHTLAFRRTQSGVKVGREQDNRLFNRPLEMYVPELVRATRNSSHGFLEALIGPDRFLLATNDGHMPRQLADLIAFFLFGFAADAEAVRERRFFGQARPAWRRRGHASTSTLWSRLLAALRTLRWAAPKQTSGRC